MGGMTSGMGSFLGSAGGQSMALDAFGTGVSFIGARRQGKEDAAALNYRAGLYDEAADATRIANNVQEGNLKAQTTRKVADQKAAFAANGVDVSSPVVGDVTEATQFAGDMDAAMMHYSAMREAFGYDTSAALYRSAAKNAKKSGVDTLIGGAMSLGKKWSAFKDSGMGLVAKEAKSPMFADDRLNSILHEWGN